MGEINIRLAQEALDKLERRAAEHGHDVAAEVASILERELAAEEAEADPIAWSRRLRAMSPNRVQQTDSLELIREGRAR